jgi:hypothetical protein
LRELESEGVRGRIEAMDRRRSRSTKSRG